MHYNLDQQLGGGFRSNMHQNASGMISFPQNAGVGMSGNSAHLANGHMGSAGVLSSTNFSTSSQPLQQPVDQLQQVSHVHRYSMSNSGTFASGNLYGSSGSVEASVDMNSTSLNPMRRVDVSFGSNQSSLQAVEKTPLVKHQQFENGNFQPSSSSKEMSHQPLEHQLNQGAHHGQYQEQEHLLNNDAYRQPQPQRASNIVSQVKHEPRPEYTIMKLFSCRL
ncbi:hypothetical protein Bca101_062825 [Brassica carinata]